MDDALATLGTTKAHDLIEVATEAQLERNGRLLVQMGGRHLVRTQHRAAILRSLSFCRRGVLRLSLRIKMSCTLSMPPATTWEVHCFTRISKTMARLARASSARGIATRSASALENVSIGI